VVVRPRDELRVLVDLGLRARVAVLLNRWLYDAALVVPYGLTTTTSSSDVIGTLARLADERVPVVAVEDQPEPEPTVEVAAAGSLRRDVDVDMAPAEPGDSPPVPTPPRSTVTSWPVPSSSPRRLAAVVSALRSHAGRLGEATAQTSRDPSHPATTVGALALSNRLDEETEPLPELSELRRRAPEEDEPRSQTANVELIIDATTDLNAQAMRRVRRRPQAGAPEQTDPDQVAPEVDEPGQQAATIAPAFDASPAEAIGSEVRRAREWLGMSVDDLADRTRIRPYVIESIEMGDFAPCGGDFYARGHLRMLTSVLGIDPAPLLASYDAHLASAPVSPRAVFDAELTTGVLRPTGGGGSRWGVLVGAVLVLLLVWGLARFFLVEPSTDTGSLRSPTHSSAGLGSPGAGNTLLVPPPVPPTRLTLGAAGGSSRVVVWDKQGSVVYRGMLHAGEVKTVSGRGPLKVMAVDGGAVWLTSKGHPKQQMGQPGQRVFRHIS
jgi:hypothetical protein